MTCEARIRGFPQSGGGLIQNCQTNTVFRVVLTRPDNQSRSRQVVSIFCVLMVHGGMMSRHASSSKKKSLVMPTCRGEELFVTALVTRS